MPSLGRLGALGLLGALALAGCRGPAGPPPGPPVTVPGSPAWVAGNMPIAIEYLRTLPADRVGKPLAGIALSDGRRWLEGWVYRGVVEVDHPGMHVVAVESPLGESVIYAWIDEDGEPWPLPECGGDQVGVRARTLAGDVYTWRSLRPGDGLVRPACPPAAWSPPPPTALGP